MTTEIFKDVPGYEGLYRVSNLGNVIRVNSGRVRKHWVVRGYHRVALSKENVQKNYLIHRIVALAFISNIDKKSDVNHIDGVKTNNSLSNLEWCTRSENMRHSIDVLGNMIGEKNPMYGKLWSDCPNSKTVVQLSKEWVEVKRFWSTHEAQRETWVNQGHISSACSWRLKSAGGYKWEFVDGKEYKAVIH